MSPCERENTLALLSISSLSVSEYQLPARDQSLRAARAREETAQRRDTHIGPTGPQEHTPIVHPLRALPSVTDRTGTPLLLLVSTARARSP